MKTRVTIQNIYSDGSGAPSTVSCQGITFSADFLGGPRINAIGAGSGTRVSRKVADSARRAFMNELRLRADAAWFDKNHAMYGGVGTKV